MKKNNRVLIVDDEQEFANALAQRCRSIGMEVETASNTLTALAIVGVRPPDLICLDIMMPTGNGLSVREFLAADSATVNKPVIFVTGQNDIGTVRRCGELNAHYVHKSPQMWQQLRPLLLELTKDN